MDWNNLLEQPAFVIYSSKLAPERKDFFTENIIKAGYKNMQIFEAVNGHDENELNEAMNMFRINFANHIGPGQRGCALSHLKLYLHMIENNIEICTIFEDDVYFHSDWCRLSKLFYENTPKNFDVLFIGNQLTGNVKILPKINRNPCYCTHAYVVTLTGAKKLLYLIANWDYYRNEEYKNCGVATIDIVIHNIQERILSGNLKKKTLIWYCWNGSNNDCENRSDPKYRGYEARNTGLVYQSYSVPNCVHFGTTKK